MPLNWYLDIESDEKLSQGDILLNCPIFTPRPEIKYHENNWEVVGLNTEIESGNIVIMNQACDLERDVPDSVLVALIFDIKTVDIGTQNRKSFIGEVHAGRRPNYSIISNYDGGIEHAKMNYQVVDFSSVYTLPYDMLASFSLNYGKRIRLNTPHRELLSQQFGHYYSRIGLPNDDFISKKDLYSEIEI